MPSLQKTRITSYNVCYTKLLRKITLEITALDKPVLLEANKRIGQLIFTYLTEKCQNPYNGKYQGQDGVVESKIYQDVK